MALMFQTGNAGLLRPARAASRTGVVVRATERRQHDDARGAGATCSSRRELALLLLPAAASLALSRPAGAVCADQATEAAGDACRAAELARDSSSTQNYPQLSGPAKVAPNVPVGDLDAEYGRATRDLASKIEAYMTTDVYDKSRQPLIKSLKVDGAAWVSKYARGGSVRSQSARSMYVAVDAVYGHLASNGLAPFPASKAKVVDETLRSALAYLQEGR